MLSRHLVDRLPSFSIIFNFVNISASFSFKMSGYVKVAEEEGEEPIELPLEDDSTLLLSTLTAQFPGTSGLKFRTESNTFRGVRLADVKFHPPENSWGDTIYYCVFLKGNPAKYVIGL